MQGKGALACITQEKWGREEKKKKIKFGRLCFTHRCLTDCSAGGPSTVYKRDL